MIKRTKLNIIYACNKAYKWNILAVYRKESLAYVLCYLKHEQSPQTGLPLSPKTYCEQ